MLNVPLLGLIHDADNSTRRVWRFVCPEGVNRQTVIEFVDSFHHAYPDVWCVIVHMDEFDGPGTPDYVEYLKQHHATALLGKTSSLRFTRTSFLNGMYKRNQVRIEKDCTVADIFGQKCEYDLNFKNPFSRKSMQSLVSASHKKPFIYGENNTEQDLFRCDNEILKELWWLNDVKTHLDELKPCDAEHILGVSNSMVYLGAKGTGSADHNEDMKLYSMNFVFKGSDDKAWLFKSQRDFMRLNDYIPKSSEQLCQMEILHKNYIIDSELMDESSYEHEIAFQHENDWLFTFSTSVHQVWNTGNNIAAAKNWATKDWKREAREMLRCECPLNPGWRWCFDALHAGEHEMVPTLYIKDMDSVMRRVASYNRFIGASGASEQEKSDADAYDTSADTSEQEKSDADASEQEKSDADISEQEKSDAVASDTSAGASEQEKSDACASDTSAGASEQEKSDACASDTSAGASEQEKSDAVASDTSAGASEQEKSDACASDTSAGASEQEKSDAVASRRSSNNAIESSPPKKKRCDPQPSSSSVGPRRSRRFRGPATTVRLTSEGPVISTPVGPVSLNVPMNVLYEVALTEAQEKRVENEKRRGRKRTTVKDTRVGKRSDKNPRLNKLNQNIYTARKTIRSKSELLNDVMDEAKKIELNEILKTTKTRLDMLESQHLLAKVCFMKWEERAVEERFLFENYTPKKIIEHFVSATNVLEHVEFFKLVDEELESIGRRAGKGISPPVSQELATSVEAWKVMFNMDATVRNPRDDPAFMIEKKKRKDGTYDDF